MPIVDGLTSTKMIRSYEKTHSGDILSARASANGRVPIIAVSASLVERERQTYIQAGFDGWILKPIDFNRLNTLLTGIVDDDTRKQCLYQPGQWERGGFFERRQLDMFRASTWPSSRKPIAQPPRTGTEPVRQDGGSMTSGTSGTSGSSGSSGSGTGETTPVNEPRRPLIHDERLDGEEDAPGSRRSSFKEGKLEDVVDQPGAAS
jgi:CheY-like chemotaxis protein